MKILCNTCHKEYEETDDHSLLMYQNGCEMICYDCAKIYRSQSNQDFETGLKRDERYILNIIASKEIKEIVRIYSIISENEEDIKIARQLETLLNHYMEKEMFEANEEE